MRLNLYRRFHTKSKNDVVTSQNARKEPEEFRVLTYVFGEPGRFKVLFNREHRFEI